MHCKRLLFKINNSVNAVVQPLVNAHWLLFVDLCIANIIYFSFFQSINRLFIEDSFVHGNKMDKREFRLLKNKIKKKGIQPLFL